MKSQHSLPCCNTRTITKVQRLPFPEDEYAKLNTLPEGNSSLIGQVFFVTRFGDVKFVAGREVILEPVTSLTTQWYEEEYLHNFKDLNSQQILTRKWDKRHAPYVRKTTCDGEGRFKFNEIPHGSYYCSTEIRWEYVGHGGVPATSGGIICKKINIDKDDSTEVNLHWDNN
jgi:hypothetical protein